MKRLFNNICAIGSIIALVQALFYVIEYAVKCVRFIKHFAVEYRRILSERIKEAKRPVREHFYM